MAVDDDFDEGPLPEAGGSGCEEDGAPSQYAVAGTAEEEEDGEDEVAPPTGKPAGACVLCGKAAKARWIECGCGARTHVECLGEHYLQVRILRVLRFTGLPLDVLDGGLTTDQKQAHLPRVCLRNIQLCCLVIKRKLVPLAVVPAVLEAKLGE